MARLESSDERLHVPGTAPNWRESYYFDFQDEAGWAGLTYFSVAPPPGALQRILILQQPGGKNTLVCMEQEPVTRFGDELLEQGVYRLRCVEPLQRWRLTAEADCVSLPQGQELSSALGQARRGGAPVERVPLLFDLHFEASIPAYRYPDWGWAHLGASQGHFEQAGQIAGRLRVGSQEIPFVGSSGRDRSWGVRDWFYTEWWDWITLRFEDMAMGICLSRVPGRETSSGFVYHRGVLEPIVQVSLAARRDPADLHLLAGRGRVVTERGRSLELEFTPSSFCHTIIGRQGEWQDHDGVTAVACQCAGQAGRGFWEHNRREPAPPPGPAEAGMLQSGSGRP